MALTNMDGPKSRAEYTARILRVQDYIEAHLADDLTLEHIAGVACFSPFHFHRLWRSLTGETIAAFILHLRLARAADALLKYPETSILEIALDSGFSGAATFARSFREAFGMTASAWRSGGGERHAALKSKNRKPLRKPCKESADGAGYPVDVHADGACGETFTGSETMETYKEAKEVRIVDEPVMTVAYVRHTGPYAGDMALFGRLFGQLCAWAGPRGFLGPQAKMLTIYHDNPDLVDDEKLRISVCCVVPAGTKADGEIGVMELPAGKCAHALFEIDTSEYGAAWAWVYGQWMAASGWQPDDRQCYELYLNDPETHPQKKHVFEIVAPVRPL